MNQNWQKNPILWIVLLVGGGFFLGMTITNRVHRSVTILDPAGQIVPEVIEVRKALEDVVIEEQVIIHEDEIVVRPERPISPVRPVRPLPPNFIISDHGPNFNLIIRSIINTLIPIGLILIGVWLIVRQNRKIEEKAP